MPEGKNVRVGEVAQQAIERLSQRAKETVSVMGAIAADHAEQQDQLRELLSLCETRAADADDQMGYYERQYARPVYGEIAEKLRGILDGE